MTPELAMALFVGAAGTIAVARNIVRLERERAQPEVPIPSVWQRLAARHAWSFAPPLTLTARVDGVVVTVRAGEWRDGGPSTLVEGPLPTTRDHGTESPLWATLRAQIPGVAITTSDGVLHVEWDRLEPEPERIEAAIRAVAAGCRSAVAYR